MNSPFVIEQAVHLAARSTQGGWGNAPVVPSGALPQPFAAERVRRISRLYQAALGREPSIDELADALEYVEVAEPPESAEIARRLAWQFGWGTFDEATGGVQFQPLATFTGNSWQGSAALPDPAIGWAMLSATGGHPGDAAHQVIRRWTAPAAGTLAIEGVLSHASEQGDGVRGRIVASRGGSLGAWEAFHSEASTVPPQIEVDAGDTIDFITDCRAGVDFDSFNWTVTLRLTTSDRDAGQMWDSVSGFHGPIAPPLTRWQQLAQVLLMSNEFMFVD
jgi:hypothetical protein